MNSVYLIVTNVALALTGVVFWSVSARLFSPKDVGITTLFITTATFMSYAGMFGLDHSLIKYGAKNSNQSLRSMISTAFTIAALGTIFFSIIYLFIVQFTAPELLFITHSWVWIIVFIWAMLATSWNNLLNSTFIALRVTYFILISSLLFGVLRIILLPMLSDYGLAGIFGSYLISFSIGTVLGFVFVFKLKRYIYRPSINMGVINRMRRYSIRIYISELLSSLPTLLLPLFILNILGTKEAAYYYMPLLIVGLLNVVSNTVGQSLFAEGVAAMSELKTNIIRSIKFIYVLLIPGVVMIIITGNLLLHIFGSGYAEHGYILLVLMSLAALVKSTNLIMAFILRILGYVKEVAYVTFVYVVILISSSYLLLNITHNLWSIGVAFLLSELAVLPVYALTVRGSWKNYQSSINDNIVKV